MNKESINVGDGIFAQIEKYSHDLTVPSTKEEWDECFIEALTPTEEEIKAQQKLRKQQTKNFEYFIQFKKEVIDMLTPIEQAYFYAAMGSCVNGIGIVGSKHMDAINKAKKLSDKYGYSENWVKDSAYGASIETLLKVNDII